MAAPNPYTKLRPSPVATSQTRSYYNHFLCKSLFLALFLVALPLFPSQAPDFVRETVFTKFWELLHLLFVGVAVSYGLFSRRNVETEVDLQSTTTDDSQSYVSRIFHVSSFFDYGSEISCTIDQESVNVNSSPRCFTNVTKIGSSNTAFILDEKQKSGSFVVDGEFEDLRGYNKICEVQAWNSQYFQGKAKVVVAQPAYCLDDYISHKPLGLPVRSLRSALRETQNLEYSHENEPFSNSLSFSKSSNGIVDGEFGSLDSIQLEEKFDDSGVISSPIPCPLTSERMEMRENVRRGTHPSHFRPLSVDESQFESFKSKSLRSIASSLSQTSFISHTQSRFSPSHSVSSESLNSNIGELGKGKSFQSSSQTSSPSLSPSPSPSPSPPTPTPTPRSKGDNASRHISHSRHYSYGSLLEEDVSRSFEDELGEVMYIGRRKDLLSRKDQGSGSLKLIAQELRRGNSSRKSYPPDSVCPPNKGEESPTRWHAQRHTSVNSFEKDKGRSSEDELKNMRGLRGNDSFGRREQDWSFSKLEKEDNKRHESFHESYPQISTSSPANDKASKHALDSRQWSHGSLLEKDVTRNMDDDLTDLNSSGRKELKSGYLKWEPKSGKAAKLSRGKSVRTFRAGRYTKEVPEDGGVCDDRIDDTLKRISAESEGEYMGKRLDMSNGTSSENLGHSYPKQKPRYFEDQNGRGQQFPETYAVNDGDDLGNDADRLQIRAEEDASHDGVSDAWHDTDEVDRKAGEFIAKFREQIRLQKLTSGELPRGTGNIGGSHFR